MKGKNWRDKEIYCAIWSGLFLLQRPLNAAVKETGHLKKLLVLLLFSVIFLNLLLLSVILTPGIPLLSLSLLLFFFFVRPGTLRLRLYLEIVKCILSTGFMPPSSLKRGRETRSKRKEGDSNMTSLENRDIHHSLISFCDTGHSKG